LSRQFVSTLTPTCAMGPAQAAKQKGGCSRPILPAARAWRSAPLRMRARKPRRRQAVLTILFAVELSPMAILLASEPTARPPRRWTLLVALAFCMLPAAFLLAATLRPLDLHFGSSHLWARGWFSHDEDPRLQELLNIGTHCGHSRRGATVAGTFPALKLVTQKLPLALGSWRFEVGLRYWCWVTGPPMP
jgi:hypothetical protein